MDMHSSRLGVILCVSLSPVQNLVEVSIYPHFGRARCFAIYEIYDDSIKMLAVEKNPIASIEYGGGRGRAIIDMLLRYGVEGVIVYEIGSSAFYRLREAGARIFLVDRIMNIEEAVRLFKEGRLREASKPVERD